MSKQKIPRVHSEALQKEQEVRNRLERQQFIFKADAFLPAKFSDENLDNEIEKIELRGGKIISLKEIRNLITQKPQDYYVMFIVNYYKEIFRLNNWMRPISQKPQIVAIWTNDLIYARFNRDVLPTLQEFNPYNEIGIRNYKHFQFLNEQGKILLAGYISEAVRTMQTCSTWYEFRIKYAKEFGLPVQLRMWETS